MDRPDTAVCFQTLKVRYSGCIQELGRGGRGVVGPGSGVGVAGRAVGGAGLVLRDTDDHNTVEADQPDGTPSIITR